MAEYKLFFLNAEGEEVKELEFDGKSEAHEAYDLAVADLNQGRAPKGAVEVRFNAGGTGVKRHAVPQHAGTDERVEARELEKEKSNKKSEDEERTEADKAARVAHRNTVIVPSEEVRNPDAGTLPPHDPNPPKPESSNVRRGDAVGNVDLDPPRKQEEPSRAETAAPKVKIVPPRKP